MTPDQIFVVLAMVAIGVLLFWAEVKTRGQSKGDDDER